MKLYHICSVESPEKRCTQYKPEAAALTVHCMIPYMKQNRQSTDNIDLRFERLEKRWDRIPLGLWKVLELDL